MTISNPTTGPEKMMKTELLARRQLSENTFELTLSRPDAFHFESGQRICFHHETIEREYSLTSTTEDARLQLCVRQVTSGRFSSFLSSVEMGKHLYFTGPHGYFTFHPSQRPPVFVATGTGLAPFLSMTRSGVRGYSILHGVSSIEDLYYREVWESDAAQYVPCLSGGVEGIGAVDNAFPGRVTDYVKSTLKRRPYDFYLCGRGEMIRDLIHLVDEFFPGSMVRTEIYY